MITDTRGLPHFLVIGAEKAGTTWLYQALRRHPDIFLPDTKEIHFFNRFNSLLEPVRHYELGVEWYHRFFKRSAPHQLRGEITPMYLSDEAAGWRIATLLPQVKLIYILREPVSRAYSHYWMARRKGLVSNTFSELIAQRDPRFIGRGFYSGQIEHYLSLFPQEQMMGLTFDSLFNDKSSSLSRILQFIGVRSDEDQIMTILSEMTVSTGEASRPRILWAHQLMSRLSKALRNDHLGSQLMDLLKQTRISRLKEMNFTTEPYEPINREDLIKLKEIYAEDIIKLAGIVDFSVQKWQEI
ncbi:MAG: sulfotransferase domain-containing protein [Bacteroidota bacterium]